MTANRLWAIGTVLIIVVLVLGTWFIGVAPQLAADAKARAERDSVETMNLGHQQTLKLLKEQFEDIDDLRDELKALQGEIPPTALQTPFIDQIGAVGINSGVRVDSVTFTDPIAFVPGESTDPELLTAMQSVSSGNFYVIPVEVVVIGPTAYAFEFLRGMQNGTRLYLSYEVTFEGTDDDRSTDEVKMTVFGQIFVLSDGSGAAAPQPTVVEGGVVE